MTYIRTLIDTYTCTHKGNIYTSAHSPIHPTTHTATHSLTHSLTRSPARPPTHSWFQHMDSSGKHITVTQMTWPYTVVLHTLYNTLYIPCLQVASLVACVLLCLSQAWPSTPESHIHIVCKHTTNISLI